VVRVEIAVAVIVAVVKVDRAVIVVGREASVRQAYRETGNIVETAAPVKQGIGHRVSRANRAIGHHVRKVREVSARREYRESDHRDRVESDHRVSRARRVIGHPAGQARRVIDRHAHRESNQRDLSKPRSHQRLNRLQRLFSPLLKSQRHLKRSRQHQRLVRLRANRGDSKPCYWHRHVQSTADNIAVV
jgi:hypothetical protein